jgi:DNA-directed RNA polymerase subunit RPC12/RpoP
MVLKRGFIFCVSPVQEWEVGVVVTCSKCGRQTREEDAVYCPYCSEALRVGVVKRTDFPVSAGVLLVIGASVCVLVGAVALGIFVVTYGSDYYYYGWGWRHFVPRYVDLFAGAFGILAFMYGVAAGVFSLKRKQYRHSLTGAIAEVMAGFLIVLVFAQQWPTSWVIGLMFGVPIILLSAAGLLFISISRKEFR